MRLGRLNGPVLFKDVTVFDGEALNCHWSVMTENGKVTFQGSNEDFGEVKATVIDCRGFSLIPSFKDSHLHLLGNAARLTGKDIASSVFNDIPEVLAELKKTKDEMFFGGWLRCYGYDDSQIKSGRALTRWDLDQIYPDSPVIIYSSSGHSALINSRGLAKLSISECSDEPNGITFDRDLETGNLNGVILEGNSYIENYLPKISNERLRNNLKYSFQQFLSRGVTQVTDATESNDVDRLNFLSTELDRLEGMVDVEFMPGLNMLDELGQFKISYGSNYNSLSIGPVKIMLSSSSGRFVPEPQDLLEFVSECHGRGYPVAIHAITENEIDLCLSIFSKSSLRGDRIEHASELRDDQIKKIAKLGLWISTQPGFIYHRGDQYISKLNGLDLNLLYRLRSLEISGVNVGGSSDAPVTVADPINSIYASMTRQTSGKQVLNEDESLNIIQSLKMFTVNNSTISAGRQKLSGVSTGDTLDAVILNNDISSLRAEDFKDINVFATVKNGEIKYVAEVEA